MYDVVAMGELLIDFTPIKKESDKAPTFEQNPGGAPANVLAMNSILGGKTGFIGKVGDDEFGHFLKKVIEDVNINASGLVMAEDVHTTLAFVHLSDNGERSFSFYRKPGADMMLEEKEIKKELIDNCNIFHFGSVSLTDEPCRSTTISAVKYAKCKGKIISYDPNYRKAIWNTPENARKEILEVMPLADIVKISYEEMEFLFGITDINEGIEKIKRMGVSLVLISMGDKGAYYSNENATGLVEAFKMDSIDTTGAGDAFLGAIHYKIRSKSLHDIQKMEKDEMEQILLFANAAGGITTLKKGAIPAMPNEDQINETV
ncbi:fructokinase [Vallitalea longa]|uniref:Fructokinase n=1 Tax=Vallitalea longa TaxID=2936439 RepID=A0A9W6DE83_9FIRM|nr:carbohydrate kinase [Vallitalea longa]GKX29881.1 fructokinase [Vallitalea longa]